MSYHVHRLDSENHQHIIARKDAITGDKVNADDEVVFCRVCQSVFLKDSWEFMNKTHCNQSETLDFIPTPIPALIAKKKISKKKEEDRNLIFATHSRTEEIMSFFPQLPSSILLGIGMNSGKYWLWYISFSVLVLLSLTALQKETLKIKKVRKWLKLDEKTFKIFETGIELQNEVFYSYHEIQSIDYIEAQREIHIHLRDSKTIKQKLPFKKYEKLKSLFFALAWAAQFTEVNFYTTNNKELRILRSIERNYAGKILVLEI